jgi:hypothetical protein
VFESVSEAHSCLQNTERFSHQDHQRFGGEISVHSRSSSATRTGTLCLKLDRPNSLYLNKTPLRFWLGKTVHLRIIMEILSFDPPMSQMQLKDFLPSIRRRHGDDRAPVLLQYRSSRWFILTTVCVAIFTVSKHSNHGDETPLTVQFRTFFCTVSSFLLSRLRCSRE